MHSMWRISTVALDYLHVYRWNLACVFSDARAFQQDALMKYVIELRPSLHMLIIYFIGCLL